MRKSTRPPSPVKPARVVGPVRHERQGFPPGLGFLLHARADRNPGQLDWYFAYLDADEVLPGAVWKALVGFPCEAAALATRDQWLAHPGVYGLDDVRTFEALCAIIGRMCPGKR
jgi:hypothetical protein